MSKRELLKEVGFSEEYLDYLDKYDDLAPKMNIPSFIGESVIKYENVDSSVLEFNTTLENYDVEMKIRR